MTERKSFELWKPICGFEGLYEVSNYGRVRSLTAWRSHGGYRPRVTNGRVMSLKGNRHSRPAATLYDRDSKPHRYSLHVLVAMCFVPNPEGLPWVLHRDDNYANNRWTNLYWGTNQQNKDDAARNGLLAKKLTKEDVLEIRRLYAEHAASPNKKRFDGFNTGLAKRYGISFVALTNIIKREVWRHV